MIEQYKKEMSEVHAPADLIERTREAMKKEEEKLQKKGKGRNITARIIVPLSVAAAAFILIAVPSALKGAGTQTQTPALLGQENTSDVQKIESGMTADAANELAKENEIAIKAEMKMTELSEMPEEFADAREIKQDGYTYLLVERQDGTGWKAYVEKEGKGYLITGIAEDEESFLQEAEKLIMEK